MQKESKENTKPNKVYLFYLSMIGGAFVAFAPVFFILFQLAGSPRISFSTRDALVIAGEMVYASQGCPACHTRHLRHILAEQVRFNPLGFLFLQNRPAPDGSGPSLAGTRRIGPDLRTPGGRYGSYEYLTIYLRDPRRVYPGSEMPAYEYLFQTPVDPEPVWDRVVQRTTVEDPRQIQNLKRELALRLQSRSQGEALMTFLFSETGK